MTFGILPTEPHTGYGYIKRGAEKGAGFDVDQFVKPSVEVAEGYLSSGEYYWNSGMFLFKASRYLEELKKYRPEMHSACAKSVEDVASDLDFLRVDKDAFEACPNESVDYAVMENTEDATVVPMDAGWNDIGSWSSLWDVSEKDADSNAVQSDVMLHSSTNSYVRASDRLVAAVGIDNLVVVATKDVVMVASKDNVQDVKLIAQQQRTRLAGVGVQPRGLSTWGKYDSIDQGEGYQVKRITVKPGAKQRSDASPSCGALDCGYGYSRVTNGERTFILSENESTYIPIGVVHCLENPGKVDLELIEVQSGSYLGEDDIVRFEISRARCQVGYSAGE